MNAMSAGLDGLNQFFELLGSLVFIALGLFFVSRDITTVENLAAIYVLYGSMSWELLQIGLYIPSMASYLANAKRVFVFLDLEEEPERYEERLFGETRRHETEQQIPTSGQDTETLTLANKQDISQKISADLQDTAQFQTNVSVQGVERQQAISNMLSLRNITFAYEGRPTLLQDYSLDIPKGKCIAPGAKDLNLA